MKFKVPKLYVNNKLVKTNPQVLLLYGIRQMSMTVMSVITAHNISEAISFQHRIQYPRKILHDT